MNVDADSSYSRLQAVQYSRPAKTPAQATRTQRAIEAVLFTVFGLTIALAGVALYATSRPEHQLVPNRVAQGLASDRVNVLLIGSSMRTGTDGSRLVQVESLTLVSLQPSTGRTALMPIPADLWVKIGRYGQRPLQSAQLVGDSSGYPGGGTGLIIDTVQNVTGQTIHAYGRVGLSDIRRVVDSVGGVDIDVQRGVYDIRHKNRFHRGRHHLNGVEAERYAFCRHIAGAAASDSLAREQRQQEVLTATLTKLLERQDSFASVASLLGPATVTNLTPQQIISLGGKIHRGNDNRTVSFAPYLTAFDATSATYRGEAVRPRAGDFSELRRVAADAVGTSHAITAAGFTAAAR